MANDNLPRPIPGRVPQEYDPAFFARAFADLSLYLQGMQQRGNINVDKVYLRPGNIVQSGTINPESNVAAPVGSIFIRVQSGTSLDIYTKDTGTGNTGWVLQVSFEV